MDYIYIVVGKKKPAITVMYLAQTTWVDEARDQQGPQEISFGNVGLRCQLLFQVEMLSRQ